MKLFFLIAVFLAVLSADEFLVPPSQAPKVLPALPPPPSDLAFRKQDYLISRHDFTLNATFYLRFLRFKQRIEISFFYNKYGELDFDYFPDDKLLTLYARNFRAHKPAKAFLLAAVNNIAYELATGFMREALQTGGLTRKFPGLYIFSALKGMIQKAKSVVRYDYRLSTFTNRVYSVQFKYLLGARLRKDEQNVKISASLAANSIIHIIRLLQRDLKAKDKKHGDQLKELAQFYAGFHEKAEKGQRTWTEYPMKELTLSGKKAKQLQKLIVKVAQFFSGTNLKTTLLSQKPSSANKFDWIKDLRMNASADVKAFIAKEFQQLNSVESFETYAIPHNRIWTAIKKGQKR